MFALSGGGNDYPILCGWNGGHHVYLDVADKSTTDLTFVIKQLKEELYTCLDRFDVVKNLNRNSVSSKVTFLTFSSIISAALLQILCIVIFNFHFNSPMKYLKIYRITRTGQITSIFKFQYNQKKIHLSSILIGIVAGRSESHSCRVGAQNLRKSSQKLHKDA